MSRSPNSSLSVFEKSPGYSSAQDKFNQLRVQAEKLLAGADMVSPQFAGEDPITLIRELQTFQIELELQNRELHQSQKELMKTQIRYTDLYDTAPIGYITLSTRGVILAANLTFADMVSQERSLLENQPLSQFIFFDDQDVFYHHLQCLSSSSRRCVCELRMINNEGTPRHVRLESTCAPGNYNQKPRYRTIVIDNTDRKKMEALHHKLELQLRQAYKMRSVCTVAGGISHDFNNIMQVILGNAEIAIEDIPDEQAAHRNLQTIRKAALRASGIVKNLINYSRRQNLDLDYTDVVSIANEAVAYLRSTVPDQIKISKILPVEKPVILADRGQMVKLLKIVGTNAVQAMEKTGGIVEIRVEVESIKQKNLNRYPGLLPGEYVRIRVSDTGPGIDPEIIDQLFDPYFTTRGIPGSSGMGLAVAHGIVKNHNGMISVKNRPEKGAVFDILVPLADSLAPEKKIILSDHPRKNEAILFTGNDGFIMDMAREFLERLGYHVTEMPHAQTGE